MPEGSAEQQRRWPQPRYAHTRNSLPFSMRFSCEPEKSLLRKLERLSLRQWLPPGSPHDSGSVRAATLCGTYSRDRRSESASHIQLRFLSNAGRSRNLGWRGAFQVLVLVPKGRRMVARGGASDSGHTRNPGESDVSPGGGGGNPV
jgi:hypothetical protein